MQQVQVCRLRDTLQASTSPIHPRDILQQLFLSIVLHLPHCLLFALLKPQLICSHSVYRQVQQSYCAELSCSATVVPPQHCLTSDMRDNLASLPAVHQCLPGKVCLIPVSPATPAI